MTDRRTLRALALRPLRRGAREEHANNTKRSKSTRKAKPDPGDSNRAQGSNSR
eukprot:CAMPEP_0183512726 /NCGR_PEP_ID=MMETSP0371-20130417/11741_1 /TAXON_ID=268820 /ORGANISM="Peridinium aciculiferum, Strain PAER-2" /LENGTH=52 /DNA_ID=CAMNT_0025709839 /DNA_START=93 /DNA_END=247 /DNA_ORIENTATION=-